MPGGNGLVEAQMHLYRNDAEGTNQAPTAPTVLESQVDGNGNVFLWWNVASDDLTPSDALTYDLRLYRERAPVSPPRRIPKPGNVSGIGQWDLIGLPEGNYTWTVQAVDNAYNGSPTAEGTFTVGEPVPPDSIFVDGFESGDLSLWGVVPP